MKIGWRAHNGTSSCESPCCESRRVCRLHAQVNQQQLSNIRAQSAWQASSDGHCFSSSRRVHEDTTEPDRLTVSTRANPIIPPKTKRRSAPRASETREWRLLTHAVAAACCHLRRCRGSGAPGSRTATAHSPPLALLRCAARRACAAASAGLWMMRCSPVIISFNFIIKSWKHGKHIIDNDYTLLESWSTNL